jgi:hypothetical protein
MTMAFASDIEKHVAVQCMAILNAEMSALDAWHWPVWRKPDSSGYSLSPKGRMPELRELCQYGGSLHKLLRLLDSVLTRAAREKFVIWTKLRELGLPLTIPMNPVAFNHPVIERCAIGIYASYFKQAKIRFIDTPGMGNHVFFDLRTRSIHFDTHWQLKLPRTILANRIMEIAVNHQRGHTTLLELSPANHILPVLQEISAVLTSSGMTRLKIAFGMTHREVANEIRTINKDQLISLMGVVGKPSVKDLQQLQSEMRLKTLSTILASTLDVVGLLEAMTGRDLTETGILQPNAIYAMHHMARPILEIATKLTI